MDRTGDLRTTRTLTLVEVSQSTSDQLDGKQDGDGLDEENGRVPDELAVDGVDQEAHFDCTPLVDVYCMSRTGIGRGDLLELA